MNGNSIKVCVLLVLLLASCGLWVTCLAFDFEMLYGATGITALAIVMIPMVLQRRIDWFAPWTFVVVSTAIGCAARGICMSLGWPDEGANDFYFLLGEEPLYFLQPCLYLLLGVTCLTTGYFAFEFPKARRFRIERILWNVPRLNVVLTIAAVFATVATFQYIRNTGGFHSDVLSGKRAVIFDIDIQGDEEFAQYGHLRQTAKLANFAYLTLLGYSLFYVRRFSPMRLAILGGLLLVACAFPFYSSSRLPIMWTFCGSGALVWYSGRQVNVARIGAIGLVAIMVFFGMTFIRGKKDASEHLVKESVAESLVNGLVIHRNFFGIAKTSHVINAVPKTMDFEYGKTIAVWAISPIPRAVWKNKPLVHSGPVVGSKVYGNNVSGVPPGMIGELFWNFHVFGIVAGTLALGAGLRWMSELFRPRPGQDLALALVYVIGPMRLGFEMVGNSVGFAVMKVIMDATTMSLILMLVLDRQILVGAMRRPLRRMQRAA